MHWIIQGNIFHERRYAQVLQTLERGGIPHTVVTVVPFAHDLVPRPDVRNPIAVVGSYTLVRLAQQYGWGPGVFAGPNINATVYGPRFGPAMLNSDARILPLRDLVLRAPAFVRPVDDGKGFSGGLVEPEAFALWRDRIAGYEGFSTVTGDTLVVVAAPKTILAEYRLFVVEGRVVAGSRYRLGGRVSLSADVPPEVSRWAEAQLQAWSPERAMVADVADTPEGLRFIEFNTINAAGWYEADVSRVIQAIDALAS